MYSFLKTIGNESWGCVLPYTEHRDPHGCIRSPLLYSLFFLVHILSDKMLVIFYRYCIACVAQYCQKKYFTVCCTSYKCMWQIKLDSFLCRPLHSTVHVQCTILRYLLYLIATTLLNIDQFGPHWSFLPVYHCVERELRWRHHRFRSWPTSWLRPWAWKHSSRRRRNNWGARWLVFQINYRDSQLA